MRRFLVNFYLAFLLFLSAAAISTAEELPKPLTLKECYTLALKQSEQVSIQSKIIEQAQAHFYQSLSAILPDISFVYTDRYQDGSNSTNFTLREIPERKFTFSQPLFSGFKEFAAIAASRSEKRQRIQEKKRAEELLFIDVSDAFYLLAGYRDEIETLHTIEKVLEDRTVELNKRIELGRSRESEGASTNARLSRIQADIQDLLSSEEVSRQLLEFLTGANVDQIADEPVEMKVSSLDEYLAKTDERSDVKAAFENWQKYKKEVTVAKGGFYPTVTVDGNYYTKRIGNSRDVDWDYELVIDTPIFKGGENVGLVKEARTVAEQEELNYDEAKRRAHLDIQNAYTKLDMAIKKEQALQKALEASEKSYQLQGKDYENNLVSNLDVMQALEDWQDSRRDFVNAKNQTKRFYWYLKAATGDIHDSF